MQGYFMKRQQNTREQQLEQKKKALEGTGEYIFQNNTKADLYLPRPTKTGRRVIRHDPKSGKGEMFIGDSYYFQMVKTHELKFIREVNMPQEKLITEVPPTVTHEGTVEYVRQTSDGNLNEEKTKEQEVLLTEDPLDGITLLNG